MLSKCIIVFLLIETQLQLFMPNEVAASPVTGRITRRKRDARSLCPLENIGGADLEEDDDSASRIHLQRSGTASSVELLADSYAPGVRFSLEKSLCSTLVKASPTHMLSFLLVPTESSTDFLRSNAGHDKSDPEESCPLNVFLETDDGPQRTPLLSVDLCDGAAVSAAMHFVESLPHSVVIEWSPPKSPDSMVVSTSIVVTSIGKGERECAMRGMVPCFKRSRKPLFCVATELVCDGRRNCPMEGDDEDPNLCSANHGGDISTGPGSPSVQEDLSVSGAKALDILGNLIFRSTNTSTRQSTEKSIGHQRPDGDAPTLAKYGTWGYLLLAMLACGGLLTMCGLWECCCRQSKVSPSSQPHHSPTTVLIINQEQNQSPVQTTTPLSSDENRHSVTPEPPAYDDLDQPPAYGTLFPAFIKVEDVEDPQPENPMPTDSPETTQSA